MSLLLPPKKEGHEEERMRGGGETRWEDVRVRETEGERRTEMTWCTFGRASQRPSASLGDFLMCRCNRCWGFTLGAEYLLNEPHMWLAKICSSRLPTHFLHQPSDCVSHTFRHTQMHNFKNKIKKAHTLVCVHACRHMKDESDNGLGDWRNSQENLSSHRRNSKRGWGAAAPVGAAIALCD